MKTFHQCLMAVLATFCFLIMVAMPSGEASASGALKTCKDFFPTGSGPNGGANSVGATCKNSAGNWVVSTVWLPGCLANMGEKGPGLQLQWVRNGFFDRSCRNCFVGADRDAGSTRPFACNCKRRDGGWPNEAINAPINLDDLSNQNGQLACPL